MSYNENKLTKLSALKSLAKKVKDDYATKSELTKISNKVEEIVTAGGEPNVIEKIKVNGTEQIIAEKSVDINVPTKVTDLTDNNDYATKADVKAQVSSVYKPGGSVEFSSLEEPSADNLGMVYNVSDAFETDDKFIEGDGKSYPAGTNVVVVDAGESNYKYDVLSGFVDFTDYAKSADVVAKETGKGLSSNDYTTAEKQKLAGIDENANNYTHPESAAGAKTAGLYKITTDANGHIIAATAVQKIDITGLDIPAQDTTYDVVTSSQDGLMSSNDKKKLDGMEIATDDEVSAMLTEVFGE